MNEWEDNFCYCFQGDICHALEELDGDSKFLVEQWQRPEVR